jgi:glutathione synthase/RimK-type ligase-like ATP-grasp enzyme
VARRHLQALDRPLLNAPDRVWRTARHQIAGLLAGVPDLVVPWVVRLAPRPQRPDDWRKRLWDQGLSLPALVRPTGSHGGKGLDLAKDPLDLLSSVDEIEGEAYITAFHDFVSPDGFYRKYRMIFIDRQPLAYHLAISPHWLVHHESSGMEADPVRQAEELRFLADPQAALGPKAMAAITEIARRIDLDYCGVDFSLLADGRVLLFEANATMLVHPEAPDSPFAAKNPYVEAITDRFQAMLRDKAKA